MEMVSNCCSAYGGGLEDYGICSDCKEHCEYVEVYDDDMPIDQWFSLANEYGMKHYGLDMENWIDKTKKWKYIDYGSPRDFIEDFANKYDLTKLNNYE